MKRCAFLALLVLSTACSRSLKPLPQNPPRIIDSVPERKAALNEAADLGIIAEQHRYGVEDEQELQRQEAEKAADKKNKTAVIPMPGLQRDGGPPADAGVDGGGPPPKR